MQKLVREPRSEPEWYTVTTKQQRRKQAPPTQLADFTSVPGSWEDEGCQSLGSFPGLFPQSSPFHTTGQGKVLQQTGWEAGSRSLTAGDAGGVDIADPAASFPQSVSSVISAQHATPEAQHQPSEAGAPSPRSLHWEVPQSDADSCSQLSTDSALPAPAHKPAAEQPTNTCKPGGQPHGGGPCDACDMSPVPPFLSAMPPGMPMPPSGSPPEPQAQQQPRQQPQQQPPPQLQRQRPQLQAVLQPQSQSQQQSQLQAQPQAQLQPQPQPQPRPQLQLSGSMSSQGLTDMWDAGSDSVSAGGQHGSHHQPVEPQQEKRRTTQQLTGWLAEAHKAEAEKQQHWVSTRPTHVPWLPPAPANQEQLSSKKHPMHLPNYPPQAWPKRHQEPNNHNSHAHAQGHEWTQKQQQVSTEHPVRLPGTQQAETSPKQQADGWDDSIADPPFNVIIPPPLQDMGCRTSKSAKRSSAWAPQHSSARTALDNKPREHQTDLLISQHHNEKSAAIMPTGSPSVSASTGATITGHSALPKGIIQPGMGTAPPYAPPVHFKSNQPNAEAQMLAASAFLPNGLQPGRGPSNPPELPMHPRDIQPDMDPWRPPVVTLPPKSHQTHLGFPSPSESPMIPNGVQPNKGLLSPFAPSLHPPGSLFQLNSVLPSSKLDSIQTPPVTHQAQFQPLTTTNISQSLAEEQYKLLSTKLGVLPVFDQAIVPPPVKASARALPKPDSPQPQTHLSAGDTPAAAGAAGLQLTQSGGHPWGEAHFAQDMLHDVHLDNKPAQFSSHQASLASASSKRSALPNTMQGSSAASGSLAT